MNNGDGLRVVLWLSGCSHNCYKCQNSQTHDPNSGILFDKNAEEELFTELSKDYISGLTLTGGDPLHKNNLDEVLNLVNKIRLLLPEKTIWLYTGYDFDLLQTQFTEYKYTPFANGSDEWLIRWEIISQCDVLVDGRYIDSLKNVNLKWRGSSNQRVISVKESLKQEQVVLHCD
jgi:anaerobic ribonucleoside-triphosphate reductase activating protein